MIEKIGILLVHGIGDQGKFEHIEEVSRIFIKSLTPNHDVRVNIKTAMMGEFKARKEVWLKGKNGTVIVSAHCNTTGKEYELHFREVWWSHLGESTDLKTVWSFWVWGISFWMDSFSRHNIFQDEIGTTYPAQPGETIPPEVTIRDRWELFVACILVAGLMPAFALFKRVLELVGIELPLDIISQYLSKVKLFQQNKRDSKELITNFGEIPRISIRREMISELVEMATGNYSRWYILAHSLGSVVAYNGLFEAEHMLPRYLDRKRWNKVCKKQINKKIDVNNDLSKNIYSELSLPNWLDERDVIDRKLLFSSLQGFLTYGSPLKKYAILWPWLVRGISTPKTFHADFEWINVYDPLDPISSSTDFFSSETTSISPSNFAIKTNGWHLDCHLKYFGSEKESLTETVLHWIMNGKKFNDSYSLNKDIFIASEEDERKRQRTRRVRTGYIFWFFPLLLVFFSIFSEVFIGILEGHPLDILNNLFNPHSWLRHFEYYILYIIIIPFLVITAGFSKYIVSYYNSKKIDSSSDKLEIA